MVRRDELIAPIVTALARRLKRTLQDNQNELLDGLRSQGAKWSVKLLPEEVEHVDSYATAALPALEQAAEAGVSFADAGRRPPVPARTSWWGSPMSWPRQWWARCAGGSPTTRADLDDAEEAVVVEHVGSAFREWKGERIERLAGDHVVAAFSAGTMAADRGGVGRAVGVGGRRRLGRRPVPRL